jgi:hypothetical protein
LSGRLGRTVDAAFIGNLLSDSRREGYGTPDLRAVLGPRTAPTAHPGANRPVSSALFPRLWHDPCLLFLFDRQSDGTARPRWGWAISPA